MILCCYSLPIRCVASGGAGWTCFTFEDDNIMQLGTGEWSKRAKRGEVKCWLVQFLYLGKGDWLTVQEKHCVISWLEQQIMIQKGKRAWVGWFITRQGQASKQGKGKGARARTQEHKNIDNNNTQKQKNKKTKKRWVLSRIRVFELYRCQQAQSLSAVGQVLRPILFEITLWYGSPFTQPTPLFRQPCVIQNHIGKNRSSPLEPLWCRFMVFQGQGW